MRERPRGMIGRVSVRPSGEGGTVGSRASGPAGMKRCAHLLFMRPGHLLGKEFVHICDLRGDFGVRRREVVVRR